MDQSCHIFDFYLFLFFIFAGTCVLSRALTGSDRRLRRNKAHKRKAGLWWDWPLMERPWPPPMVCSLFVHCINWCKHPMETEVQGLRVSLRTLRSRAFLELPALVYQGRTLRLRLKPWPCWSPNNLFTQLASGAPCVQGWPHSVWSVSKLSCSVHKLGYLYVNLMVFKVNTVYV